LTTAKKTAAKKSAPNPADSDAAVQALEEATEQAREEALVRRDAMQELLDKGYTIVNTAENEDGDFYFEVESDNEEGTKKAYMSKKGKLTMEGK